MEYTTPSKRPLPSDSFTSDSTLDSSQLIVSPHTGLASTTQAQLTVNEQVERHSKFQKWAYLERAERLKTKQKAKKAKLTMEVDAETESVAIVNTEAQEISEAGGAVDMHEKINRVLKLVRKQGELVS